MTKLMVAVLTSLFVMGLSSVSFAGMADMLDKAAETTEKANTMTDDAKAKKDSMEQKSIETQDASKKASGSMTDHAKETAKETVNEKIDSIGK